MVSQRALIFGCEILVKAGMVVVIGRSMVNTISYLTDEHRSQTGWSGVQECEVVFARTMSTFQMWATDICEYEFFSRISKRQKEASNG